MVNADVLEVRNIDDILNVPEFQNLRNSEAAKNLLGFDGRPLPDILAETFSALVPARPPLGLPQRTEKFLYQQMRELKTLADFQNAKIQLRFITHRGSTFCVDPAFVVESIVHMLRRGDMEYSLKLCYALNKRIEFGSQGSFKGHILDPLNPY